MQPDLVGPHCVNWISLFSPLSSGIGKESHCANGLHAITQLCVNFLLFLVMISWGFCGQDGWIFVGQTVPLGRSLDCLLGSYLMTLYFNDLHLFLNV